jgi:murein DD-endopeptidase MepM/ murein hydrolase activator NlpD
MKMLLLGLALLPPPLVAEVVILGQNLQQGGFKLLELPAGSTVRLGGSAVPMVNVGNQAYAMLGFERKEALARWLEICLPTQACTTQKLEIAARTYRTQNVRGAPKAKTNPDKAALAQMQQDNAAIRVARAALAQGATRGVTEAGLGFLQPLQRPSTGPITGVYGSARLFDGQERSWHKGLDYAAPIGTPIYAPASGVVRLAKNTFMNGNLILLDHGGGLNSMFAHLNKIGVQVGQVVQQGEQLGEVGNTGRSSGPHLHWGLYVGATPIDPQLWVAE